LLLGIAAIVASFEDDRVVNLPGLNESISFKQYAGYLTVDATHGRKLFYWFVESQNKPSTDPVVLWLNGGPGCSSLIGFLSENGPFRPYTSGQGVYVNPHSWNRIANMLYLEAPAGVGFSYSKVQSDYTTDDNKTAQDNLQALVQWFKKYPQYKARDFYISGESYAGHYIPTLTQAVLTWNQSPNNYQINLKGILVGNGLTDNNIDLNSPIDTFAYHGLISLSLYNQLQSVCQGNYIDNNSDQCNQLVQEANTMIGAIDPYDIYAPVCEESGPHTSRKLHLFERVGRVGAHAFDPCIDLHLTEYLNLASVRSAIHADAAAGHWDECSGKINYNFSMSGAPSMIPLYENFIQNAKLRILIYSGDVDAVVPFLGTVRWIETLSLPVKSDFVQWLLPNKQVGGYWKDYTVTSGSFTYLSIRDAGHMVPFFKPESAFTFFSRFIRGQPF